MLPFDALVTCLVMAGVVSYWAAGRGRRGWIGWLGVGVCAGLASLTKPFVGVPLVVLLAVHALFVERGQATLGRRLFGILLGILALAAVAGPWYAAQARKHPAFANETFRKNLVERVTRQVSANRSHVQKLEAETKAYLKAGDRTTAAKFALELQKAKEEMAANEQQRKKYLPQLASGKVLGGWGLTEPGSGSDAGAAQARAVRHGDRWRLSGTKTFITQGSAGQI